MWQHHIHDLKIFQSKIQKRKKHKSEAKLVYNYLLLIQSTFISVVMTSGVMMTSGVVMTTGFARKRAQFLLN